MEVSSLHDFFHRGMAPDAKVAFVDLADSSGSGIKIPQDLSQRYFPLTYGVGSRVHSDSWGSASQDYDYMASQVDLFTWENQVSTQIGTASGPAKATKRALASFCTPAMPAFFRGSGT